MKSQKRIIVKEEIQNLNKLSNIQGYHSFSYDDQSTRLILWNGDHVVDYVNYTDGKPTITKIEEDYQYLADKHNIINYGVQLMSLALI